ncbi:hypothetical protein ABZZ80_34730, partial [Streptomyces sp. NPDC006356]
GHTLYASRPTRDGAAVDETWDTRTGRRQAALTRPTGTRLALRPDGRLLVGDNRVTLLPAGRVRAVDLTQGEGVTGLAFTADGSRLAVGDLSGRVALWDGDLRHRMGVLSDAFPGSPADSPETIGALAMSPDGRTLAVAGDAGTLQLWDIETRKPLGDPLPTPGEAIESLAFGSDNRTLYASGAHVPLQRYVVDPDRMVRQVCARVGTELPRALSPGIVPDTRYREACA